MNPWSVVGRKFKEGDILIVSVPNASPAQLEAAVEDARQLYEESGIRTAFLPSTWRLQSREDLLNVRSQIDALIDGA